MGNMPAAQPGGVFLCGDDAVETTNLGGGIDIWVPKQDTYEKWRDSYELLKEAGEEMWFYTCAFPAGRMLLQGPSGPG